MNELKQSKAYKEALRNMTWLIGVSIIDFVVLAATLIWFNRWFLFCFLVITILLVFFALATYFAVKDLKMLVLRNGSDNDFFN
ncbi:hypothetical protein [Leuconostoc citreum]